MEPEIIFKRKITEKLLVWKNESKGEKALLIEGARRIGKSTAVEEFELTKRFADCHCSKAVAKGASRLMALASTLR